MVRRPLGSGSLPSAGSPYVDGYGQYFGDEADDFRVRPASPAAVEREREQWALHLSWNERRGAGTAPPDYPGRSGIDARHDGLDALPVPHRQVPNGVARLVGELRHRGTGHQAEGTGCWFRWRPST